ncbi:MAG TPA: hypothetical protein P5530_01545, partial [Candidatus Diapherotrites archaeon]|nr:hypothetical protein [Candidatus Diapherotrites archaeon]
PASYDNDQSPGGGLNQPIYPTFCLASSNNGTRPCTEADIDSGKKGCVCVRDKSGKKWVVTARCATNNKLYLYARSVSERECTSQQANAATVCGNCVD